MLLKVFQIFAFFITIFITHDFHIIFENATKCAYLFNIFHGYFMMICKFYLKKTSNINLFDHKIFITEKYIEIARKKIEMPGLVPDAFNSKTHKTIIKKNFLRRN
jgi:hypothetical protein